MKEEEKRYSLTVHRHQREAALWIYDIGDRDHPILLLLALNSLIMKFV